MKFNALEFIKDVGDLIVAKLKPVNEKLNAIDIQVKEFTPYDDAAVLELIAEAEQKREDTAKALLEGIKAATYDDEPLMATAKANAETIEEIRKEFKDEVAAVKKAAADEIKKYQTDMVSLIKEIGVVNKKAADDLGSAIAKVDAKEVMLTLPKAVNYNMENVDRGVFVKWNNSLWLNLMDDNDTPPSRKNHSYQLIIEAPKEIEHKGLYDPKGEYHQGNIVMFNDNSWFKTSDPETTIPSKGWKLLTKRGKQGKKGEKGDVEIIESDVTEALQELFDEVTILKTQIKAG